MIKRGPTAASAAVAAADRDEPHLVAVTQALTAPLLRSSIELMLDGFALVGSVREHGRIVDFRWDYINAAGATTYRRSTVDLVGRRMGDVLPNFFTSGRFADYCHVVESGEPLTRSDAPYHDRGAQGVFNSRAWKHGDGVASTWQDVTDVHDTHAALRASHERFQSTIQHLPDAVSVFEAIRDGTDRITDFRWTFANPAAADMTGHSAESLVGRTLLDVLPDHEPSGMLEVYRQVVQTGEPHVNETLWYEDTWGDGRRRRRAFDIRATRVGDGFVVVTREVTELRLSTEELVSQRLALQRANAEALQLNALGEALQACTALDDLYPIAATCAARLFPGLGGGIALSRDEGPLMDVVATWRDGPVGNHAYQRDDCLAVRTGEPHTSAAGGSVCSHLTPPPAWAHCVPLLERGAVLGALHFEQTTTPEADMEAEKDVVLRVAPALARQLALAVTGLRLLASVRERGFLLNGVVENSVSLIYVKDLEGRYLLYNQPFADAFGLAARAEAEGATARVVLIGRDDTWLDPALAPLWRANDVLAATGSLTIEEFSEHPERGRLTYDTTKFPLFDGAGTVYATCGVSLDTTERVRAVARSKEAEDHFRSTFDNAPVGMAITNPDGLLVQANEALCALTGYTVSELVGKPLSDITHPDDVAARREAIRSTVEGEKRSYRLQERFFNANGHIVWVESTGSLVRDARGDPLHMIVQLLDISERKRLEAHLRRLADEDSLTGARSRRLFEDDLGGQVGRCQRYGEQAALLLIDLDDFKAINDTYGHRAGDLVLKAVCAALRGRLRTGDHLGRIGGDEFAVLMPHVGRHQTIALATEFARVIAECRVTVGDHVLAPTASVGAAFMDESVVSEEEILAEADRAMYASKRAGKDLRSAPAQLQA